MDLYPQRPPMFSNATRSKLLRLAVAMVLVLALIVVSKRPSTPSIRDAQGQTIPGSIAWLERVQIGGIEQWLLIRGRNERNPVLLFLHGGPGLALMPLAHVFQRNIEEDFVVVQWDMRGSGKSYNRKLTPDDLKEDRLVSDVHDVAQYLCTRLHQQKIYVVGHSFGSYLGLLAVQRYPELFHAFIGVGQVADYDGRANLERAFIRREASLRGEEEDIKDLDTANTKTLRRMVVRYGGDVHAFGGEFPFLKASIRATEYSWPDYLRYVAGLWLYSYRSELFRPDPPSHVRAVTVPVYFFLGKFDAVAPPELAGSYLQSLSAPSKTIVWFEHSGHWPFLEEPQRFREQMHAIANATQ